MGSSPSSSQAQCPVSSDHEQPVYSAQFPVTCMGCNEPKVKWKCKECVVLMCDKCKTNLHTYNNHHINEISTIQVKLYDLKKYDIPGQSIECLAVSNDNLLWMGTLQKASNQETPKMSLQKLSILGNQFNIIDSFAKEITDIAVTSNNDILLATVGQTLHEIKAGFTRVTSSKYVVKNMGDQMKVHETKGGRVMISGMHFVEVLNKDGKCLNRYHRDVKGDDIFSYNITSITSTIEGNIFVASKLDRKVVVFSNNHNIINVYKGHSTVHSEESRFSPSSLVTTPKDNVIVADCNTHSLQILNNTGDLLTTLLIKDMGMSEPNNLAITTEGSSTVLFVTCLGSNILYKMFYSECLK